MSLDVTFIYVLKDPVTGEVRYVGKADKPSKRFVQHLQLHPRHKDYRARWIRSLLKRGLKPQLEVVDEVPVEYWQALEAAYVAFYKELGFRLVNSTPGGDGGAGEDHPSFGRKWTALERARHRAALTPEVRAKLSAARFGKPMPPESIAKTAAANRGRQRPLSVRNAVSRAQRGKAKSPETREKLRLALLGRKLSVEMRAKLSVAHLGHECNTVTRQRISAAYSEERKAATRARLTGIPRSPEVRAKIRATKARGQMLLPL